MIDKFFLVSKIFFASEKRKIYILFSDVLNSCKKKSSLCTKVWEINFSLNILWHTAKVQLKLKILEH